MAHSRQPPPTPPVDRQQELPDLETPFINYPDPQLGPDVPYLRDKGRNPSMRGAKVVCAAYIMESWNWVRSAAWRNAGFGNLRYIRPNIEDHEPRTDPTVLPASNHNPYKGTSRPHWEVPNPRRTHASGYYSVADYHRLYLTGEITPEAVAKALLPLIRRDVKPASQHSIAWFDTKVEAVLKAARSSTTRYKEGKYLGPLDGVPFAVKDEYEIDGYLTSLGSRNDYTSYPEDGSSITSWAVRKLEEAGAIVLGKLSMHEFGLDTCGSNIFFGTPKNPYNDNYYTGGSSSGSAYAVACGLIPFALGSDGGGSIRIPASFCGVFGLKPSHGRVSYLPGPNHSNTCAVYGPIAADVTSLAAVYEVISQPHPTSYFPHPTAFSIQDSCARNKVLGIPDEWVAHADPGVRKLYDSMLAKLVAPPYGYRKVIVRIPFLSEGQMAHAMTILTDAAALLPNPRNLTPANKILLALGRVTPATDYLLAQKLRNLLMKHLAHFYKLYPNLVIVTPTTACAGWKIKEKYELVHGVQDGDKTKETMRFVWLANFCGLPALTVPAGYVDGRGEVAGAETEGKIPVGFMGIGEWTQEQNLTQFGLDAESAASQDRVKPPIWVDVVGKAREEMARTTAIPVPEDWE